jgi:hypothetical protein
MIRSQTKVWSQDVAINRSKDRLGFHESSNRRQEITPPPLANPFYQEYCDGLTNLSMWIRSILSSLMGFRAKKP